MCFLVDPKHSHKQIAKRDIVCYKVLSESYTSPYYSQKYEINKIYKHYIGRAFNTGFEDAVIEEGFHSCSTKKYAISFRRRLIINPQCKFIIVRCIIPQGSEYYYNSEEKEYVSNQIIIKEQIK